MKQLHSKQKGNIGEAIIAADLMKQGFSVFTELGDFSKIDLVAEFENNLYKIQCKCYKTNNHGTVELRFRKSGPNYRFTYSDLDFDIFALYVYDINVIAYVTMHELMELNKECICLRVRPAKGKQKNNPNINMIEDYNSIERCLDILNNK